MVASRRSGERDDSALVDVTRIGTEVFVEMGHDSNKAILCYAVYLNIYYLTMH